MFYNIGIAGPPSGLSDYQVSEIKQHIKEALRTFEHIHLWVWRDTGSRHPVGGDHEDVMVACARTLVVDRVDIEWVEYSDKDTVGAYQLHMCDIVFICHANRASKQKSRTGMFKRHADEMNYRFLRIVHAWHSET